MFAIRSDKSVTKEMFNREIVLERKECSADARSVTHKSPTI